MICLIFASALLRTFSFLAVSLHRFAHAQVGNKEIKSCRVLSFNEISLVGSGQEAVYQDIALPQVKPVSA